MKQRSRLLIIRFFIFSFILTFVLIFSLAISITNKSISVVLLISGLFSLVLAGALSLLVHSMMGSPHVFDRAEQMKAQEQLINAEKLAAVGRMAAGFAHELKSPLTGIITFAHLLLKHTPPEKMQDREDLNVIIAQADRCATIVNGLLGFSRKRASEESAVDLNTLVEATVATVRHQAKFYNIIFDVQLDTTLPELSVDPIHIQQVFLNLLINAADAMEEKGTITIQLRRAVTDTRAMAEIEFMDSGPGISVDYASRIFEPFFTTKPAGKGTGLGLSVSYGIIKQYGGDITVRSEKGKGARFVVALPIE